MFCQHELEFCGYILKEDGIAPAPDTIAAIREFPRPTNLTGIRSLFGLMEQVSFAFSKTTFLEPFRNLLSNKEDFKWNQDLQNCFEMLEKKWPVWLSKV